MIDLFVDSSILEEMVHGSFGLFDDVCVCV